ncbi:MAG: Hpt domain-containing protein [Alphaproteobacteria bacterium]
MVQATTGFGEESVVELYSESAKNSGRLSKSAPMVCSAKFSEIKKSITASDLKMLLDIVQEMLGRELEVLDSAVASKDVSVAKSALHKLKGLCGNYGLIVLADEAKDLEAILKNDEDEIKNLDLDIFSSYIARSIGELKQVQASL